MTKAEKEMLIEKIRELYDDEWVHDKWNNSGDYRGGFDDGVGNAIKIIQAMPEDDENKQWEIIQHAVDVGRRGGCIMRTDR